MRQKINNHFILTCCVFALILICFLSVYSPMRFQEEREKREQTVKERLVTIRQAEESYKKVTGVYSGDFATLIKGGFLADSITLIPYSDEERFELAATMQTEKSGKQTPLMECGAQYQQYLNGLDENSIANLIENANESGHYPGLRIGDLTSANNNAGNWE